MRSCPGVNGPMSKCHQALAARNCQIWCGGPMRGCHQARCRHSDSQWETVLVSPDQWEDASCEAAVHLESPLSCSHYSAITVSHQGYIARPSTPPPLPPGTPFTTTPLTLLHNPFPPTTILPPFVNGECVYSVHCTWLGLYCLSEEIWIYPQSTHTHTILYKLYTLRSRKGNFHGLRASNNGGNGVENYETFGFFFIKLNLTKHFYTIYHSFSGRIAVGERCRYMG